MNGEWIVCFHQLGIRIASILLINIPAQVRAVCHVTNVKVMDVVGLSDYRFGFFQTFLFSVISRGHTCKSVAYG